MHADHITGSGLIKKSIPTAKSVISVNSQAKADIHLKDGLYFYYELIKSYVDELFELTDQLCK